jgi:hypothetical protein
MILWDCETGDVEQEEPQNEVFVVPWGPESPPVKAKIEYTLRTEAGNIDGKKSSSDQKPAVTVIPSIDSDSPKRIVLTVHRAGTIGANDYTAIGDPDMQEDDGWDTTALLSWIEYTGDILTELKEAASPTTDIFKVQGLKHLPEHIGHMRMIGDSIIVAHSPSGSPPIDNRRGDWLYIGDYAPYEVIQFLDPDQIKVGGGSSPRDATLDKGTEVRIQPRRAHGRSGVTQDGHFHFRDMASAADTTWRISDPSSVAPGMAILIGTEYMRVVNVWFDADQSDGADGRWRWWIEVERGLFGSKADLWGYPEPGVAFLYPESSEPMRVGATGLIVSFIYDKGKDLRPRKWVPGDRIIFDYEGTQAKPSNYYTYTASNAASVNLYGKRQFKIEKNPMVGITQAPHLAHAWLQYIQSRKLQKEVLTNLAVDADPEWLLDIVSAKLLPDEASNTMKFYIMALKHSLRERYTIWTLLGTTGVTTTRAEPAGVGYGEVADDVGGQPVMVGEEIGGGL